MRKTLLACALVALLAGPGAPSASAAIDPASAEASLLKMVNGARAGQGLGPLVSSPPLVTIARDWSSRMSSTQALSHEPDLDAKVSRWVTAAWTSVGQNVGRSYGVESMFAAFWNSPTHRAQILGDYDLVGIGVVVDARGEAWATLDFVGVNGSAQAVSVNNGPTGSAYWVATGGGGVLSYCSAPQLGSAIGFRLARPVVGMASTPTGRGYWLVASDGGIFAFGDAKFYGSTGAMRLARPVVGMASTSVGRGYWLVASDGGIFSFGDARFHGSAVGRLLYPATDISATPTGGGYRVLGADGTVVALGDAQAASGSC